jgi:quinol monooxygenase YgiN
MIHVIATIEAQEGQRDALIDAFHHIIPSVQAKQGCLEYGLAVPVDSGLEGQEQSNGSTLTLIEKWASLDILKAHLADPKYQDWFTQVWPLMAGASMQVLEAA